MLVTFLAGMLSGAALLVAVILVSDHSFLDLIKGRLADETSPSMSAEREQAVPVKNHRSLAAGSDT